MAGFNETTARSPNEILCKKLEARRNRLALYGVGSGVLSVLLAETPLGSIFFLAAALLMVGAYLTNVMRKKKGEVSVY